MKKKILKIQSQKLHRISPLVTVLVYLVKASGSGASAAENLRGTNVFFFGGGGVILQCTEDMPGFFPEDFGRMKAPLHKQLFLFCLLLLSLFFFPFNS